MEGYRQNLYVRNLDLQIVLFMQFYGLYGYVT